MVVTINRDDRGYHLSKESCDWLKTQTADTISLKPITESKARSIQQLRAYWSVWLPTFCSNVAMMDAYVTQDFKTGRMEYETAHRFLMLKWALAESRADLIETVPCVVNNRIERVGIVHLNFEKCSQKDAQAYFDYIQKIFFKVVGKSIEDVAIIQGYEH